jgi:hypothetical protein
MPAGSSSGKKSGLNSRRGGEEGQADRSAIRGAGEVQQHVTRLSEEALRRLERGRIFVFEGFDQDVEQWRLLVSGEGGQSMLLPLDALAPSSRVASR